MKQQPKFIPGIYNYCDRWCERCSFTSRCRNYEDTSKLSREQLDPKNKAFWKGISDNFEKAGKLLHKAAKKYGIDLSQPLSAEEEKAYEERKSFIESEVKKHELYSLCRKYCNTVVSYFEKNLSQDLVDKTRQLISHLHMGMNTPEDVAYTMAGLGECEQVINWYLHFIEAKLRRALQGKLKDDEDDSFPKDSEGSAKIAIIAIERSMGAWVRLYEMLPVAEDTALPVLSILSRLKEVAVKEFPKAMEFHRPGFDD
ncbi:MAG TPA: hypothetical protein VF476_16240 [Chitinophagaceae bacterium]